MQMFDVMQQMGADSFVLTKLWRSRCLLRCSLESRKPVVDFESNSNQEGKSNTWSLPSMVGRGTKHPKSG